MVWNVLPTVGPLNAFFQIFGIIIYLNTLVSTFIGRFLSYLTISVTTSDSLYQSEGWKILIAAVFFPSSVSHGL